MCFSRCSRSPVFSNPISKKTIFVLGVFADDGSTMMQTKRFALREIRDLGFGRRSDDYERILEEETKDLIEAIKIKSDKGESVLIPETFFPPLFNCIFHILTGTRVPFQERHKLEVSQKSGSLAFPQCIM